MEFENSQEVTSEDLVVYKDSLSAGLNESVEVKIVAIKQLRSLAQSLGPLRTRNELLDIVTSQLENLEDEVLYYLAEELEFFVPLVGGPEFSFCLLSILLKISRSIDETLVRNKALETIKKLLPDIDQQMTEKIILDYIVDNEENEFSEKCSSLSLIPACYAKASLRDRDLLRQKYAHFFEDDSASIRDLAASDLPQFIEILEIEHVLNDILPLLNKIVNDEDNMVKANSVEIAMSIASKSKNHEIRSDMLDKIEKLSKNESWFIRQRVAIFINQIVEVFSHEDFISILLQIYENLTNDDEMEVRIYAAQNVYGFTKNLYENCARIQNMEKKFENIFLEKLMPIILSISDDSDEVQIALSSTILCFSTIISNECFKSTILPLVIDALEKPKPLVFKENLFINLDYLPKDVNLVSLLGSINKIIQNIIITSEGSWRTRRSLLITLVHISKFCNVEFFKKNLLIYYIILLKDNTFAVRRTASMILPVLVKRFGAKWLLTDIIPHIHATLKDEKYLFRYIILFCIQELLFPSIDQNKNIKVDKYLGDIKGMLIKDAKKYGNTLCKIFRLHNTLMKKLQEKPFENIINTYVDNYNISGENVRIYSEELLDTIIKNNANIYSVEANEQDDEMCYLEGILILLNREILGALRILIRDPINNIQDRAKFLILEIKKFSDNLNEEMKSDWVLEYTNQIEESIWDRIDNDLEKEMNDVEIYCNGLEKTDIRLQIKRSSVSSVHSEETGKKLEKVDIFPSDYFQPEEIFTDAMESFEEETKDT